MVTLKGTKLVLFVMAGQRRLVLTVMRPFVKPQTIRTVPIRTVLSLAMARKWSIHKLDVKNAFLHEDLKETVYMHQQPGFIDSHTPDYICRLRNSLWPQTSISCMVSTFCYLFTPYGFCHHQK